MKTCDICKKESDELSIGFQKWFQVSLKENGVKDVCVLCEDDIEKFHSDVEKLIDKHIKVKRMDIMKRFIKNLIK